MQRTLHTVVTTEAGGTLLIVVLAGAVHLVNGSPSGHHFRTVPNHYNRVAIRRHVI